MSVIDTSTIKPEDRVQSHETPPVLGRLGRGDLILGALLSVALASVFFRWFLRQFGPKGFSAKHFEDWGHAYFVPFVAGLYIWQNRESLAKLPIRPYWPAVTLIPLAVVMYVYFILNWSIHMFQGAAMVLAIAGLVLLLAGPVVLRALAFPIGYLLFAVTISEQVMNRITWELKIIASKGSYLMLNMLGVDTDIEGNILKIHHAGEIIPLNVADACSGMRMVVAFVALGVAVAFLASKVWWKRIAIVLTSVPVAIFMNIVRVTVLGVLTLIDPDLASGEAHTFIGTLLLVPAFLLFMGFVSLFDKLFVDEPTKSTAKSKASPTPPPTTHHHGGPPRTSVLPRTASIVAMTIFTVSALGLGSYINASKIVLTKKPIYAPDEAKFIQFPLRLQGWERLGSDQVIDGETLKVLGTTNYLTRGYRQRGLPEGEKPKALSLHLAYYTGTIDTVPHVPERCLVGAGWTIATSRQVKPVELSFTDESDRPRLIRDSFVDPEYGTVYLMRDPVTGRRVRLPLGVENLKMSVTEFRDTADTVRLFAGYFFIANGRAVPTSEHVRGSAYKLENEYAYYAKIQFSSHDVDSADELAQLAAGFLDASFHEIMRLLPDWVEVEEGRYPPEAATAP